MVNDLVDADRPEKIEVIQLKRPELVGTASVGESG
jgi:hypothetical protein